MNVFATIGRGSALWSGALRHFAASALVFCLAAANLRAGTTWTGGGADTSWGTAGNWGGTLPSFNGTDAITVANSFTSGTTLNLNGNRYIDSLTINAYSAFTIASGTGGTLNLRSGNITRIDYNGKTEATQTISSGIVLGDPTGVAAYSGTLSIAGSNGLVLSGNISEVGGSRGLNMVGAASTNWVQLSGTNTFSGGLTATVGTIYISADANMGASSGGLTFNGGIMEFQGSFTSGRSLSFTGSGGLYVDSGYTVEFTGALSGNGALVANDGTANAGTLILSGSGSNGTGYTQVWNNSVLSLRGTVSLGSGVLELVGGSILELGNSNFTRSLGTAAGQVNMAVTSTGAGFAAWGADRMVNLGGVGATVTWGAGSFVTGPLMLGSSTSNATLDFQNGIDLGTLQRTVEVARGTGSGPEGKISGVISGAGGSLNVAKNVTEGRLLLTNGNNSYSGSTIVQGGELWVGANATSGAGNTVLGSSTSAVQLGIITGADNAALKTYGAFTVSRNISVISGNTGTATLGGASADASTFSGTITLGSTTSAGHNLSLSAVSGGTVAVSGVIADPSGLTGTKGILSKEGAGTVVLSGTNTYGGGTAINAGTLSISTVANLGATTGVLSINSGTLEVSGTFSTSRSISLNNSTSTVQVDGTNIYTVTSTAISGNGALNKTGSGTMQLGASNTFIGGTNVSAGTLQITASERLADAGALTVSGGTFDLQTFNETVAAVTLSSGTISGSGTLTGSSYALQSGTVNAVLGGTAALTKSTTGSVSLNRANTFTGSTTVNAGTLTLAANSGGALATTSAITVNSGGTLALGASNQIKDTAGVTLAGGTFSKGNYSEGSTMIAGVGALTLSASGSHIDFGAGTVGSLTFASFTPNANRLVIDNWTGSVNTQGSASTDRLIFTSDQTANLSYFSFSGYAPGATEYALGNGYYEVVPTAVPEPSTDAAAILALAGLAVQIRRRRN